MHETLLVLERLYELDAEIDERRRALQALEATLSRTDAELEATDGELAELDARIASLAAEEAELQQKLDRYIMRRDRTRSQLDQGLITDVLVAERQIANFDGIIDELELSMLDRMEQQESLGRKRTAVAQRRRLLQLRRDKEAARLAEEGGAHEARIAELVAVRPERVTSVPGHILADYEAVRATHRDALARLKGGACSACYMHHPPQVVLEVRRGMRLHHCRGCNRFLAGVVEPDRPDAEPDDED